MHLKSTGEIDIYRLVFECKIIGYEHHYVNDEGYGHIMHICDNNAVWLPEFGTGEPLEYTRKDRFIGAVDMFNKPIFCNDIVERNDITGIVRYEKCDAMFYIDGGIEIDKKWYKVTVIGSEDIECDEEHKNVGD
jgi:hypothetical protein